MELSRVTAAQRALLTGTLALCALLVAGCTTINLQAPPVATEPAVPGGYLLDTSGTVTVGVSSLPTNFNPSTPAGDNPVTHMVMEQVWPQPFITDPTFNVESTALLAGAEVQGVSPFRVVYDINPSAVWSDGTPITSADFTYAWKEHLTQSSDLPSSGLVAGYRDIVSVSGSNGGRTVTVTFRRPFAEWQSLFADLVPAHVAERYGWSRAFEGYSPSRVISGGPFKVSSYDPGHSLTLIRNPRYWGTAAHIDRIRFVVEHGAPAMLSALQSGAVSIGELDPAAYAPGQLADGLLGAPTVVSQGKRRTWAVSTSLTRSLAWSAVAGDEIWQLCFNLTDGVTVELGIRRGVEHALDRSEILADSEGLVYQRAAAALSRFTLLGEGANPSSPGTTPLRERVPVLYHPDFALSYFRQAGYLPGAGGLLRYGGAGAPLRLTLLEPSGYWAIDQAGLIIEAELRTVGVTLQIEREPLATMLSTSLPEGDFQLALAPFAISTSVAAVAPQYSDSVLPRNPVPGGGIGSGTAGLTSVTEPWSTPVPVGHEPGAVAAGGVTRDVLGVSDPFVNANLVAAMTQLNPPAALADLQRADYRMWNQAYTIPLFQAGYFLAHSRRVDNVSASPTWAGIMWDAQDWAIVKQAPTNGTTTTTGNGAPAGG